MEDFQRRVAELRFVDGVEKVEHVPYPAGDEFWVRFNRPFDMRQMADVAKKHSAVIVKFGGLPSKLPRPVAELLWDGVSYLIARKLGGWSRFTASLGFEPDGLAKIATDAHGPYQIYIATSEAGIQILYDYLGLKYVAPTPPTKAITPAKPQAPTQAKPVIPVSTPKTVPPAVAASAPVQQTPQPPRPAPTPSAQPAPAPQKTVPKGQYRPHAWGQKVGGSEQASAESKSSDDKSA